MATDIIADISSIIPRMIFGIVLILAWIPVIFFTEFNNKGNSEEYNLLLDKIKTDLKLTDISNKITYAPIDNSIKKYANFDYTNILNENKNIYIHVNKITRNVDNSGKYVYTTVLDKEIFFAPLINGITMSNDDYRYLALQNLIKNETTNEPTDTSISYQVDVYTIPQNKQILSVEGLQQFSKELDMTIFNYEFGPNETAIETLKSRKSGSNVLQTWLGRIGTFLMLFGGFILLVAPLETIVNMGESLPGPLKLLALPGRIILNIYSSLSFIGAFILTLLMTLFIWSIINYPLVSVLIGSLLIGFMMYFGQNN